MIKAATGITREIKRNGNCMNSLKKIKFQMGFEKEKRRAEDKIKNKNINSSFLFFVLTTLKESRIFKTKNPSPKSKIVRLSVK